MEMKLQSAGSEKDRYIYIYIYMHFALYTPPRQENVGLCGSLIRLVNAIFLKAHMDWNCNIQFYNIPHVVKFTTGRVYFIIIITNIII